MTNPPALVKPIWQMSRSEGGDMMQHVSKQLGKTPVNLLEERGKVCVQTLVKDGRKTHYPTHLVEQSDL